MAVAKVIEIIGCSHKSFEDAINSSIAEASKSIHHIHSAWVRDQSVCIENNKIVKYKVILKVTFEIKAEC